MNFNLISIFFSFIFASQTTLSPTSNFNNLTISEGTAVLKEAPLMFALDNVVSNSLFMLCNISFISYITILYTTLLTTVTFIYYNLQSKVQEKIKIKSFLKGKTISFFKVFPFPSAFKSAKKGADTKGKVEKMECNWMEEEDFQEVLDEIDRTEFLRRVVGRNMDLQGMI